MVSPVFDLAFFKLVATVFTSSDSNHYNVWNTISVMVVLIAIISLLKYVSKVQKTAYVNDIIEMLVRIRGAVLGGSINWLRMVILELLNIVISFCHVSVISIASLILSVELGIFLVVVVIFSLILSSYFFNIEVQRQSNIKDNKDLEIQQRGGLIVLSRIQTTEKASICINITFLVFFIALVYSYSIGAIPGSTALIFVFLVRFVSSNMNMVASALFRLARGWTNIESKFIQVSGSFD